MQYLRNTCDAVFVRMQANKAVTRNGSVMGGSIMVGITHCSDQSVLDNVQTSMLETSVNTGVTNLSSTLGGTPRSIRPLTQVRKLLMFKKLLVCYNASCKL